MDGRLSRMNGWKRVLGCGTLAAAAALLLGRGAVGAVPQLAGVNVPGPAVTSLPAAEFQKLHRGVAPGRERWAEIPWETDLAQARDRSAREGKPLLMWIMDGHPLGCT